MSVITSVRRYAGAALVLCSAVGLLGTQNASALTSSVVESPVIAAPRPAQQSPGVHNTTLSVLTIYAHDDADSGANCGDFDDAGAILSGDTHHELLALDNGQPWHANAWNVWQNYCSDTGYQVSGNPSVPVTRQRYHSAAEVGSIVRFEGVVCEIDPTDFVWGDGTVEVEVPAVGQHRDFTLMVEGSNFGEHLRLEIRLRLATS